MKFTLQFFNNSFDENTCKTIRALVRISTFRKLPQYPAKILDRENREIPKSPRQKSKEIKYSAPPAPQKNKKIKTICF